MWEKYLLISLVTMCIVHTVTQERIFKPLRDKLGGKETWRGYLISCPYCFSHWVAFVLVPLFGLRLLEIPWNWGLAASVLEWFFNSILVVILAAFIRMAFFSIDDLVGVFRRQERLQEEELRKREHEEDMRLVRRTAGYHRPPHTQPGREH